MTAGSRILIIDYGSQYTQLIARRVREARVYSEIHPPTRSVEWIRDWKPTGIILSGGPNSVYGENVPTADPALFDVAPVLGVCYGMQLIAHLLGSEVTRGGRREYGRAEIRPTVASALFEGFDPGETATVWMSHGDHIESVPPGFRVTAASEGNPLAAFEHESRPIYGVQFHPEVAHTPRGRELLANFLFKVCGATPSWTAGTFIEDEVAKIRELVGDAQVICGLSGGVDSSVAAALVHRAIGDQLTCVFVDTGLLRLHEREQVERTMKTHMGIKLVTVDASQRFLDALAGVEEPEAKRRAIGHTFIDVFEEATASAGTAREVPRAGDAVSRRDRERVADRRTVGDDQDAPQRRRAEAGDALLPHRAAARAVQGRGAQRGTRARPSRGDGRPTSFPGPGLAIRVLGAVSEPALHVLRQADAIYLEEIRSANLYDEIWQAFAVLLPIRSVGVMGDERTYDNVVALRAVTSTDGMTADWYAFPARGHGADLESDHPRGGRRESRRLRRELQATRDDRVGMT